MNSDELRAGWLEARDKWPTVQVALADFDSYVRARVMLSADGDAVQGAPVRWADLYLACACARGDAPALAAFEGAFAADVNAVIARIDASGLMADEIRQFVRERLFVVGDARLKIAEYSGRGDLRAWLRITATRMALNYRARPEREVPVEADALAFLAGGTQDPELAYLKRLYAEQFRLAFADAFRGLESRERSLLRYAFAEKLSVEVVGRIYGVHRATAARWIVKAQEALVAELRTTLRGRLGVSELEYESVLRLIESQVDLTVERYLSPTATA